MKATSPTNNCPHPGQILRERFMNPLKITAYRLSKELKVTPITISHLLRGKRGISTTMAAILAVFFDVPGEFWLNLQAKHDLSTKENILAGCRIKRSVALEGRCIEIQNGPNGDLEINVVETAASTNGQNPTKKGKRNATVETPPVDEAV